MIDLQKVEFRLDKTPLGTVRVGITYIKGGLMGDYEYMTIDADKLWLDENTLERRKSDFIHLGNFHNLKSSMEAHYNRYIHATSTVDPTFANTMLLITSQVIRMIGE